MDSRQKIAIEQMQQLAKSMDQIKGVFKHQRQELASLNLPKDHQFHKMAAGIDEAVKTDDINAIHKIIASAAASLK